MQTEYVVDIPTDPGRIVLQKKCLCTYVLYTVSREYNPKTKQSNPKRVTIGKVCPDDPSKMFPNKKFKEFYPEVELNVEQEACYEGDCAGYKASHDDSLVPAPYRSDSVCIGPYVVLDTVCNDNNLMHCLEDTFGEKSAALTMDLASYLIVTEGNQAQHYPAYAWEHALFTKDMHIYSDSTISRHQSSITQSDVREFLTKWNSSATKDDFINLSYDSSNKNSQAGDVEFVGFGKPKVDVGTGIINVAVAYDVTNQIPLFYELYPGAIPDVSQLSFAVTLAAEFGYKFIRFIIDRGYFSRENIEFIDANGYHFVMMVKGYNTLVAPLVSEQIGSFEKKISNQIIGDLFGMTIEHEFCGRIRYFHVFHSLSSCGAQSKQFLNSLEFDKTALEKNIGRRYSPSELQKQFFNMSFSEDGLLISFSPNDKAIEGRLSLLGYFSIVTSEPMTAAEAYFLYKSRDSSEKLFCSCKTFIGSHCFRVHSSKALYGKMFIEFVALILRNRIYSLLKDEIIKRGKSSRYLNVPAAFRELNKIRITRSPGQVYRLHYQLTKEQKLILAPFGISHETIQRYAREISQILANSEKKAGDGRSLDEEPIYEDVEPNFLEEMDLDDFDSIDYEV